MIAVVGGSGFIGTSLINIINSQGTNEFTIIDKVKSRVYSDHTIVANILDYANLEKALEDCSCIVNLAAEHKDDVSPVSLYYDVNVEGAKNVCKAAEVNGIKKIVFTSSVAVYGLNKPNPNEEFETNPFNDYGNSKLQAEEVYREWQQKDPEVRCLVIIRPTVVFGEGNRGNVYNLLKQIASGKFLRIGKGSNIKSMAYVKNISSFIQFILPKFDSGFHLYNYADKPDLSMNELIGICEDSTNKKIAKIRVPYVLGLLGGYAFDIAAKIMGRSLPVSSVRIKKFCATTQFNATKMRESGFLPKYTLNEGLSNTLKREFP